MNTLDLWLLGLLAAFVVYGWRSGLVHMVGSLVGSVLGVILASRWYEGVSTWIAAFFGTNPLVAKVFAFGIVLALANRAVGLAFSLVGRVIDIIKIIPGIAGFNRLGGVVLGLAEGALTIGLTLFVATKFDVSPAWRDGLAASHVAPILIGVAQLVVPLMPAALKYAQSVLTQTLP